MFMTRPLSSASFTVSCVIATLVTPAALNLLSVGITGCLIFRQMENFGGPPPLAVLWLSLALIPVSALFSALCLALASFARARLAQGCVEEAMARANEAYAAIDANTRIEDGEATVRLAYAEALLGSARRCEAVKVVAEALAWLHRSAQTLDDSKMRASFLERIPEHRRLGELAAELGLAWSAR